MKCFDEGTIQAFLDGELTDGMLEKVAHHLGACDDCALRVSEAETEFAFLSENLNDEFNVAVPSENLRNRIFAEIETLEQNRKPTFWQQLTANFGLLKSFQISIPMVAGFASLLIIFGTFAFFLKQNPPTEVGSVPPTIKIEKPIEVAETSPTPQIIVQPNAPKITTIPDKKPQPTLVRRSETEREPIQFTKANFVADQPQRLRVKPSNKKVVPIPNDSKPNYLDGEETYLKTIATLSKDVDKKKDEALRPSLRVGFERDLAVVNNAIASMQIAVRRNPKDESAKQILFSSYQNKIDMLSSVANRSELVASK